MKSLKFTIAFSFLFLSFFHFSQSNTLVVFSQNPTPFYVVLDGVKKNEVAETRVVVPGIRQTNSNVQIFFKDESIAPISKNIWWDEAHKNDEVTFRIVPTKKGYKLRFFSTVPNKVTSTPPPSTSVAPAPQASQNVQSTTTTIVTETTTLNNNGNANGGNVNMNTGMDANSGNISMNINVNDGTNTATGNENVNMSMNINVNEGNMNNSNPMNGNMNVNMNINDASMNNAMNQANSNMAVNMNVNETITSNNTSNTTNVAVNETVTTTTTTTTINEAPVAAAPVSLGGCLNPVQDMGGIMAAIDDESFDEGKMIVAKQATSKKCLTVDQIKQIMDEFSFSENKLDFAKYGYKRCYNPDEYYKVNAAFDFSSDKEKLNEYINDQN